MRHLHTLTKKHNVRYVLLTENQIHAKHNKCYVFREFTMKTQTVFNTAELSRIAGVKAETLRVWRSRGLYSLGSGNGHKKFTSTEVYQTALIIRLQNIGLSFEEALNLATDYDLETKINFIHESFETNDNSHDSNEKIYIGVCWYVSDVKEFGEECDVKILNSSEVQHIDRLFLPVVSAFGDKQLNVISNSLVQVDAIIFECFIKIRALIGGDND